MRLSSVSIIRILLIAVELVVLASCDVVASTPPSAQLPVPTRAVPTLFPSPTAPAATSAPEPQAPAPEVPTTTLAGEVDSPDTGWLAGSPGVELRRLRVAESAERPDVPITVIRVDPASVRLRVVYAPERPLPLRVWFAG